MEHTTRIQDNDINNDDKVPEHEQEDCLLSHSSSSSSVDNVVDPYLYQEDQEDGGAVEDLSSSVQHLVSRHRGGACHSPQPKKRDRALSPTSDSHDSPKRRSLTEGSAEAGKFVVRAARNSHHNLLSTIYGLDEAQVDTETDDLMAMIRQTQTSVADDVDQSESISGLPRRRSRQGKQPGGVLISQVTAELAKKFESEKEPEEKKPRSSEPLLVKTDALHDPDDLDSSHAADLQHDLDPQKPLLTPEQGQSSPHNMDKMTEQYGDLAQKVSPEPADNFDLDSSGDVEKLKMLKSGSFSGDTHMLVNSVSLADELQQVVSSEDSDTDSSEAAGQYNVGDYQESDGDIPSGESFRRNHSQEEKDDVKTESDDSCSSGEEGQYVISTDKNEAEEVTHDEPADIVSYEPELFSSETDEDGLISVKSPDKSDDAGQSKLMSELQQAMSSTSKAGTEADEEISDIAHTEEDGGQDKAAVEHGTKNEQISIRPYKCPQDHENLDINVKSLVHLFEEDVPDEPTKEGEDGAAEKVSDKQAADDCVSDQDQRPEDNSLVCGSLPNRVVSKTPELLPDIVVCSGGKKAKKHKVRFEDDFYEPVVILPQPPKLNSPGKFVKTWEHSAPDYGAEVKVVNDNHNRKFNIRESTDSLSSVESTDASLYETLKDIIDRTSQFTHKMDNSKDKRHKRIRLKDATRGNKRTQKAFKDKVEDLFSPNQNCQQCEHPVTTEENVTRPIPHERKHSESALTAPSGVQLREPSTRQQLYIEDYEQSEEPANEGQVTIYKEKTREEPGLEGTDLDFSVLQSSQPLNVDVTKQRITLRQKGSLAKRRKPTRTSIRSLNPDSNLFTDSTEPRPASPEEEDEEEEKPRALFLPSHEQLTRHADLVTRSSSMPAERRALQQQPQPKPVLLPGLGEHIKRRTKSPVPLPKPVEQPKPSESSPPPWMAEMRNRRGSRQLKPELEKVPSEPRQPESPSWMRDALSKKKRAAELLEQQRVSQQDVEIEQPTVAPWMKELRRGPRPVVPPVSNNNGTVPSSTEQTTTIIKDQPTKISNLNEPSTTPRQDSHRPAAETPRSRAREVLAPIKRSSVDNSAQPSVIDNRLVPPSYNGTSNGQVQELSPNKNVLPPLKLSTSPSSTSQDNQENSESPVPTWRKEIAARRKSKTFVPAIKPESPLKLTEMPSWKRELAERNKIKKRDSIDIQSVPSPTPPSSTTAPSPSMLPWQQELAQRRKRTPSITRQNSSDLPKVDVPSWAKNVERRRARLADCGLIENHKEEMSG